MRSSLLGDKEKKGDKLGTGHERGPHVPRTTSMSASSGKRNSRSKEEKNPSIDKKRKGRTCNLKIKTYDIIRVS